MTRTFIALLDTALQRHLGERIRQMALELPALRWVDVSGIHLTLAFLGELTDEQLSLAMSATEYTASALSPFSYRLDQLGIFGPLRQPRTIWAGIDEKAGRFQHLHSLLNTALEERGFSIDRRPFAPHLTLSRLKAPLKPEEQVILQQLLAGKRVNIASPQYTAKQISVMKSELLRTGAKYTCLRSYDLLG